MFSVRSGSKVFLNKIWPPPRSVPATGVQEKEKVQQGYIIKTGPGYAIPMPVDEEPWKNSDEQVKYVPLQAREGDLAVFLVSGATEVLYEGDKYYIVPQSAILMLEREEDM